MNILQQEDLPDPCDLVVKIPVVIAKLWETLELYAPKFLMDILKINEIRLRFVIPAAGHRELSGVVVTAQDRFDLLLISDLVQTGKDQLIRRHFDVYDGGFEIGQLKI